MTEYNFRHQTKMMSIELAGLRAAKHRARISMHFAAYFVGFMHRSRVPGEGWLA
jgi:hypothetical protein